MGRPADLTAVALEGYQAPRGTPCPYLPTSDSAAAWNVGRWLEATGRPQPSEVRRSRGYTMWANDMLLNVTNEQEIERLQ